MLADEFDYKLGRLEKFFNRNLTNDQRDIWFEKLKSLRPGAFGFAVDKITSSEKTFPTPQLVIETAKNYTTPYSTQKPVEDCYWCDGDGTLSAENAQGLKYVFRCHQCHNWLDKCEAYPEWSDFFERNGYKLVRATTQFRADDTQQMRGLAILREMSPKVYAQIIAKQPELEAAVNALGPVENGIRDMNDALGIQKPTDNEQRRQESLRKNQMETELGDFETF